VHAYGALLTLLLQRQLTPSGKHLNGTAGMSVPSLATLQLRVVIVVCLLLLLLLLLLLQLQLWP
jgi:hypothetical protein